MTKNFRIKEYYNKNTEVETLGNILSILFYKEIIQCVMEREKQTTRHIVSFNSMVLITKRKKQQQKREKSFSIKGLSYLIKLTPRFDCYRLLKSFYFNIYFF